MHAFLYTVNTRYIDRRARHVMRFQTDLPGAIDSHGVGSLGFLGESYLGFFPANGRNMCLTPTPNISVVFSSQVEE